MQPLIVRQYARKHWRLNKEDGERCIVAMQVCTRLGLFLPLELWFEINDWLEADAQLETMYQRFHIIAECVKDLMYWQEALFQYAYAHDVEEDEELADLIMENVVKASDEVDDSAADIIFYTDRSFIHCSALGYPEAHVQMMVDTHF